MNLAPPPSVLIVEDERLVAMDLQQSLNELGYEAAAIASSAEEALLRASERRPDVILMDIKIRGSQDGIETAKLLQAKYDVPIVYLTAYADESTIERAKQTRPYGYILKPVKAAELRSSVEIALHKHEMDRRLAERERWFSTTLESIADAVITVDPHGNVSFMNPVAEELTGVSRNDAIGRPARDVVRILDPEARASPLEQALTERKAIWVEDAALQCPERGPRMISDSAAPVVDEGRLLGAVMVFRDVTEQKLLQQQLELSDRLASLGTMAAGVAHEVNNPLAVIVGNASVARDELSRLLADLPMGARVRSDIRARIRDLHEAQSEIEEAAERIGRIVSDLKGFSRPEPKTPGQADVARAVEWAIRSTEHEFRHRAHVSTELGDVPPVALDETKLGQILVNLLLNAAHALPSGHVRDNDVSLHARLEAEDRVVIEVRDTGTGMPPDVLKRVFEPFFTTKPIGSGTGLGLSICHGIATSAGGELEAESQAGNGSVFRLVLPAVRQPTVREIEPPRPFEAVKRRGRILVVDDEEMVLRAMRRILDKHETVCMTDAREAVRLLESGETFDVIFSDLIMPEMTGMEFFEELCRTRPDDASRVVFLTGGAATARAADFLAKVTNLCLEKPFEVASLRNTVDELVASSSGKIGERAPPWPSESGCQSIEAHRQ